jgi:hypothetical protein
MTRDQMFCTLGVYVIPKPTVANPTTMFVRN